MAPSRQLLPLLSSLGSFRWTLIRTLRSDNPLDLNGELRGTATFTLLPATTERDWLYSEEGEIPSAVTGGAALPGLRWTKKYIWRESVDAGRISVWFVKVTPGPEEADYLFHNFDFPNDIRQGNNSNQPDGPLAEDLGQSTLDEGNKDDEELVTPPTPPNSALDDTETTVLTAQGNHLCINDMYRTAYAFRILSKTGEVVSWASRHVVKGPKKNQDIVNRYERA
ncbi:hypothetical protein N7539_002236 [Penicillium diatomitis]|uniref:DUF6314 domain-containing protein n=1 Tax=Penicillium diatomitis TaxID=2819901 RepID=A0A9W9XJ46_9EURO|nr:uncharacterized protein N7539_002236 [Penicillium diatomitis]KAJ5493490.1 hypothetical protein N7539_002236 [Penicillium diatomitis]